MKNCTRIWCQKLCAILFLATYAFGKIKIIKHSLLFDSGTLLTEMGALVGWILMSMGVLYERPYCSNILFHEAINWYWYRFQINFYLKIFCSVCGRGRQLCSCYMSSQWLTVEWIGFQIVIKQRRRNRKKRELLFWSYCAEKKLHTHAMERDNKT